MDTITKPTMKVTGLTFNSNQVSQTFIWKNDHRYIWIDTTCFLRSRVELGKCWLEIFNGNCIEVPSGLLNLFLVEQKLIFKSITVQSPLFYSILIHLSKLNEFQCIHLTFLSCFWGYTLSLNGYRDLIGFKGNCTHVSCDSLFWIIVRMMLVCQ